MSVVQELPIIDPEPKKQDERSLCGVKECQDRASTLMAWPLRNPVPLCASHKNWVQTQIKAAQSGKIKIGERDWLRWAKDNCKPHLFGEVK